MYMKDIYSPSDLNLKKHLFALTGSRRELREARLYIYISCPTNPAEMLVNNTTSHGEKPKTTCNHPRTRL